MLISMCSSVKRMRCRTIQATRSTISGPAPGDFLLFCSPGPPNNTPKAVPGHSGPFREKSAKILKIRSDPTRIPGHFGPFPGPWGQNRPGIKSASQFSARGCLQSPIWSREGPNQASDTALGRSWAHGPRTLPPRPRAHGPGTFPGRQSQAPMGPHRQLV